MGRLHPANFPLNSLDVSERRVVEALLEYTDHAWIVMPDVRIGEQPPVQIDIVVAHPAFGVAVIEVKGYRPEIRNGLWITPYDDVGASGGPPAQLTRNRYALRDRLRDCHPDAQHLQVDGAVAFPNTRGVRDDVEPIDLRPEQLIWSGDLEMIDHSLERLIQRGRPGELLFPEGVFGQLIRTIRPDVEFDDDLEAQARWARTHIDRVTRQNTLALERLDANRKVYVSGGAGTGKSRLAIAWAVRAAQRGERTLLTCFNEPLGAEIRRRTETIDGLTVGPFFPIALSLDGIPPLDIPDSGDTDFWNHQAHGHLHLYWPEVVDRFDTVVVDEAQDFSPAWLAQLEALLDPDGPRRFLLVGDLDQELHQRGFIPPRSEDGWTVCELVNNTRNSSAIGRLLRRRLHGPPAPAGAPETSHLRARIVAEASDPGSLTAAVIAEVETLEREGHGRSTMAVVCLDSQARDHLLALDDLCRFEDRAEGLVLCDTVRRLKGLEFPNVILVGSTSDIDEQRLYIGVSRAVLGLSVIGPLALAERLDLGPEPVESEPPSE